MKFLNVMKDRFLSSELSEEEKRKIKQYFDEHDYIKEDLYLFSENKLLKKAMIIQQLRYQYLVETNIKKYKNVSNDYNKIKIMSSKLIEEISIPNNSFSNSLAFASLLHSGSFSNNLNFTAVEDDNKNIKDIKGIVGLDVINGYFSCRHACAVFQDVFDELKICGEIIGCRSNDTVSSLKEAFQTFVTHSVNLIEYNNVYYAFDAFNINMFEFEDEFTMKSLLNSKIHYYKPYFSILFNNKSFEEVLKNIEMFKKSSQTNHITLLELSDIINETDNLYHENIGLVKDFQNDTAKLKRNIVSNLRC